MDTIYLDNNATTQPAPQVTEAVSEAYRRWWANPSSVHRAGQHVRQQVELARAELCKLIGCKDREIIFTSGATESNNLVLRGVPTVSPRKIIVTIPTEHSAVREPCQQLGRIGYVITHLPVDINGLVNPQSLRKHLARYADDTALVSIQWANNETGVIQPIAELAALCREHRVPFHTDATQAVGKIPLDVAEAGVDLLSLSAHKFHGPKGVGSLFVRSGVRIAAQVVGGPQERERRGGTENVPAIIGMGTAAKLASEWLSSDGPRKIETLRDKFERTIVQTVGDATINAGGAPRLWNTTNIGFRGLEAEAILILLSEKGVYASAGAACSSGSLEPSPVLLAMGIEEPVAHGSLRFSLSRYTTGDEIDRAIQIIPEAIAKLRSTMPV